MGNKRPIAKKRNTIDVPEWKLRFLLEGVEPEPDTFESLVFCTMTPKDPPCRWGSTEPWFKLWEKIKDDPTIKQWQAKNGKTFAEKLLKSL